MIVTIDGPAGAGKSSVARSLAKRMSFRFLDTGAMYRAVALVALRTGVELEDGVELGRLVESIGLRLEGDRVFADGQEITQDIRTPEVTQQVRFVADNLAVRTQLSALQRNIAQGGNIVTEGRDQGTIVFPDADCKIYLTASEFVRAERRHAEMLKKGMIVSLDEVLRQQKLRDKQDSQRPIGRLVKADDAMEIVTDGLTTEEVTDRLEAIVRSRM